MKKIFFKMHGLGNDFAIFEGRKETLFLSPHQVRALGDRKTGIGFDQLVIIDPSKNQKTDCFLRIYNSDGGEVGACGNATRCVALLLMNELKKDRLSLETNAACLEAWMNGDKVTVDMGKAHTDWQNIPISHEQNTLSLPVDEGILRHPVAVSVGNPHAVFFVDDLAAVPLEIVGPRIEHDPLFPEKTNVEAVQVLSRSKLRMRVWERGVGITMACGTGACAAAVAGVRRGLTDRRVTVVLDGGELDIEWRESDSHVLMTGDVAMVYRGELEV